MEIEILSFKLFILFITACVVVETETQTCTFKVSKCDYILSMVPGNNCQGHQDGTLARVRRSSEKKPQTQTELLGKKIKRVQNKLTREMQKLSTRILRGVRRMETAMLDIASRETNKEGAKLNACPTGFVTVDKWRSCYLMSHFNTSWYEAKDYCNALDSQVVSLLTLKEHFIVTYLIRNNPEVQDADGWWTSGTFYPKTKQWMWASDTELRPLTFIKWAADEPNEKSLQCIMLNARNEHLWHDEICTENFNFVCKVDI